MLYFRKFPTKLVKSVFWANLNTIVATVLKHNRAELEVPVDSETNEFVINQVKLFLPRLKFDKHTSKFMKLSPLDFTILYLLLASVSLSSLNFDVTKSAA